MPQTFTVRVITRAKKNEVREEGGGSLRVRLTAPPVEGKANEALRKLLAEHFKVAKSHVVIISGEKSRAKKIRIT